jgi:hypothetical protein
MTQERLVFPINVPGYGEIQGMLGWQTFIKFHRERTEAYIRLVKHVREIEAYLGAPDNPEDGWSAFEAIQKLKDEEKVDAAIAANEWIE